LAVRRRRPQRDRDRLLTECAAVGLEVEPHAVDVRGVTQYLDLGADALEPYEIDAEPPRDIRCGPARRPAAGIALDGATQVHEDELLAEVCRSLGRLGRERRHRLGPHVEVRRELAPGRRSEPGPPALA